MTDKDSSEQEKSQLSRSSAVTKLFHSEITQQISELKQLLILKAETGLERVDLAEFVDLFRSARAGAMLAKVSEACGLTESMLQWAEHFAENWCQECSEERDRQQELIKQHIPVLLKACKCLQRIAEDVVSKGRISDELDKEASILSTTLSLVKSSSSIEQRIDATMAMNSTLAELSSDKEPVSQVGSGELESEKQEAELAENQELSPPENTEGPQNKEVTPALQKIRNFFWKELEERVEVLTQHLLELEQGLTSTQRLET